MYWTSYIYQDIHMAVDPCMITAARPIPTQIVIPTKEGTYRESRASSKDGSGGLPPHRFLDEISIRAAHRSRITQPVCGLWANEILGYPKAYGVLKRGKDLVDKGCERGMVWVLPASCIPEEATNARNVGLFIRPASLEVSLNRVIVHPESVIVLNPLMQRTGEAGKADEKTRIPLRVSNDELRQLSKDRIRYLLRGRRAGLRPIVRWIIKSDGGEDATYTVFTDGRPYFKGVSYNMFEWGSPRPYQSRAFAEASVVGTVVSYNGESLWSSREEEAKWDSMTEEEKYNILHPAKKTSGHSSSNGW